MLHACPECDLLVKTPYLKEGAKALCPRCKKVVATSMDKSMDPSLALSLTGIFLFVPANILPVMSLEILGLSNSNTMILGVEQLFKGGYWWMAFLVMFCSIIAPLIILCLNLFNIVCLKMKWAKDWVCASLKLHHHLLEWGMSICWAF